MKRRILDTWYESGTSIWWEALECGHRVGHTGGSWTGGQQVRYCLKCETSEEPMITTLTAGETIGYT